MPLAFAHEQVWARRLVPSSGPGTRDDNGTIGRPGAVWRHEPHRSAMLQRELQSGLQTHGQADLPGVWRSVCEEQMSVDDA